MVGIQRSMADDLFYALHSAGEEGGGAALPVDASSVRVLVAFFEIYGGRCQVKPPGAGRRHICCNACRVAHRTCLTTAIG